VQQIVTRAFVGPARSSFCRVDPIYGRHAVLVTTAPLRTERLAAALLLILFTAGCASTPQAALERDAEAKQFRTHPASAALYVFRQDTAAEEDSVLYVDDRLIGATLPRTYFRIDARPGKRRLHGVAADSGSIELDVRAGEIHFVALQVSGGNSYFTAVDPAQGRQAIRACCALLENWAPGQRPLLR